jgi:hypothetical protein
VTSTERLIIRGSRSCFLPAERIDEAGFSRASIYSPSLIKYNDQRSSMSELACGCWKLAFCEDGLEIR